MRWVSYWPVVNSKVSLLRLTAGPQVLATIKGAIRATWILITGLPLIFKVDKHIDNEACINSNLLCQSTCSLVPFHEFGAVHWLALLILLSGYLRLRVAAQCTY